MKFLKHANEGRIAHTNAYLTKRASGGSIGQLMLDDMKAMRDAKKARLGNQLIQYAGLIGGAGAGALIDRRNRLRGILVGGISGAVLANAGKTLYDYVES